MAETQARGLRVLWATDGSSNALNAVPLLRQLVLPVTERLSVLTVVPHGGLAPARPDFTFLTRASKRARVHQITLGRQSAEHDVLILDPVGVQLEVTARWGNPIEEILRAANSLRADLIVMGARGHSNLALILLGSVTQGVVQHSTRPVLVVRPGAEDVSTVLVGYDGSPSAKKALRFLDRLALPPAVRFLVSCVVEPFAVPATTPAAYRRKALEEARTINERRHEHSARALEAATAELRISARQVETEVLSGPAGPALDETAAKHDAGLIVVGSRKPSASSHYLLGSTAEKLVRHARASVLVVR